jgi:membrane protein involved in colicin uptake
MAPRKQSNETSSPKTAAPTDAKPSATGEAAAKEAADAAAKAEAEADAKAKAEAEAKAAALAPAGPERRKVPVLCHVRLNGKSYAPEAEPAMTSGEFDELKRSQAVEGEFEDY